MNSTVKYKNEAYIKQLSKQTIEEMLVEKCND